jgi:carboxypeptidase C (cathepsin A)
MVTSTPEAAKDFEVFLIKFFKVFPELASNDLYIFGESYAGHYIPGFAAEIVQNKIKNNINLVGVGIGDGLTSVYKQLVTYDSYGYSIGIITPGNLREYKTLQGDVSQLILQGNYSAANDIVNEINGDSDIGIGKRAGDISIYNYRHYSGDPSSFPDITFQLNRNQTRVYYNIPDGINWTSCNDDMFGNFSSDISTSFQSNVSYLLQNIRVLIYNGQDDILINNAGIQK